MSIRSWWRFVALFAVLALVVAACDSDSSDDSNDNASDDMDIPQGPPVSGDPFKIGVVYASGVGGVDLPDLANGAQAAAQYVNDEKGGIDGRPVEVVECNAMADPAAAADCGQNFVDEGVIAVTGLEPTWGDNGLPVTDAAGIPFIGLPISFAEFTTPTSHPFGGGSLTAFPALAKFAAEDVGVENAAIIHTDIEAGKLAAETLLRDPLEEAGVDVTLVSESSGAADFTPAVAEALSGDPDSVFILFDASDCGRILAALEQAGYQGDLFGTGACANDEALEVAGESAVEGFYLNSDTHYRAVEGEPEFEDAQIMIDRLDRYADQEVTSFAAATFSEVVTAVNIANDIADEQGVDAVSAETMLAQIESLVDYPIFDGDVIDSTAPVEIAGVATGVYVPTQRIYQYTDGEFVDVGGGWVNGFE
ncbi:MAG: ABC transporter substrate-binding protein [Acidimicrobiia bacterium]